MASTMFKGLEMARIELSKSEYRLRGSSCSKDGRVADPSRVGLACKARVR